MTEEEPTLRDGLEASEITRRLQRLDLLERLLHERSVELAWANERLVAELYDRAEAQAQASRLERTDPATGLPNRRGLEERLEEAIGLHLRSGEPAAVILVGLARLSEVRESLGYRAGDAAARQVADRLRRVVRGSDLVARVGDDQFAVVLLALRQSTDAATVARKLFDALDAPLPLDGRELRIEPSLGVAVCPHDGASADLLVTRADAAMKFARAHRTGLYQFFRPDIVAVTTRRLNIEAQLRAAVERDQFRVHFQPRFDLKTRHIVGAEALLRWQHPDRGLLSPGEFLDVAEETGLIVPIGESVLRQACAAAVRWGRGLSVAVNLSPREFRGRSLLAIVEASLRATGLAAQRLQVEVSEAAFGGTADEVDAAALRGLRSAGIRVSLDAFGAGAASLSLLSRLPVDGVKIDGRFVRHALQAGRDGLILEAIARLGRRLQLRVIATGVETEDQLRLMRRVGCHEAQGFFLGRPLDADLFSQLLDAPGPVRPRRRRARPAAAEPAAKDG